MKTEFRFRLIVSSWIDNPRHKSSKTFIMHLEVLNYWHAAGVIEMYTEEHLEVFPQH